MPAPPREVATATPWQWPLVLALAGILAFANSLNGLFTFDDIAGIVENETIRTLWPLTTPLSPPSAGQAVAGRPLANLSFALNYAIDGLEPRGYHLVNIALHIGSALLLFACARRTLASRLDAAAAHVAGAAALIWVAHPLVTESVDYVAQRTELLFGFFLLLTLYASIRSIEGGWRWPAAAVAACAAGVACKESMAVAPLLVVLYDRVFVYRTFGEAVRARAPLYAALAATWLELAALVMSGPRWETAGFSTGVSPWTYLLNQCVILVAYLIRVVWPVALVHDYGEPLPVRLGAVLPQAIVIAGLLLLSGWALLKRPAIGFLAAAFFILLGPTSSVIPIATEVGAERRMYLPLAAIAVLAAAGLYHACTLAFPRSAIRGTIAIAALIAMPLAALTHARNRDYASERTLWETSLARWPQARAHRNLATALKHEGAPGGEILEQLRLSIDGSHPEARYALGFELIEQGRTGDGIQELRRYLIEAPNDTATMNARALLGDALSKVGRFDEAAAEYSIVANARPTAKNWMALGLARSQGSNPATAIDAFDRAVTLDGRDPAPRRNLAGLLIQADRPAEALLHAEAAVRLDPAHPVGHLLLGVALASTGRLDEAAAALGDAIERDPSLPSAAETLKEVEQARRQRGR